MAKQSLTNTLLGEIADDTDALRRAIEQHTEAEQKATDQSKKTTVGLTGLQKSALAASAAATGIAAAAGGPAWDTFSGSLKLVSIQLANFLIPALVDAADYVQDFAGWLEGISPGARKTIENFAELAGGAVALAFGISVVSKYMNPWTVGIIAVIAALKGLESWVNDFVNKQKETEKAFGEQFTFEKIKGTQEFAAAQGIPEQNRMAFIRDRLQSLQHELGELGQRGAFERFFDIGDKNKREAEVARQIGLWEAIQEFFQTGKAKGAKDILPEPSGKTDVKPLDIAGFWADKLGMGDLKDKLAKALGLPAIGLNVAGGGRRAHVFDFPHEMQARFSSIEEARKQFQLGALKSPLEQETMRLQRQAAQKFLDEEELRRRAQQAAARGVGLAP